jgi:diphthine-ammonia ligase
MVSTPQTGGGLNVIALISGGKDSFFSALHCLENGHRVVALANLHPPTPPATSLGTTRDRSGSVSGYGASAHFPGGNRHGACQPANGVPRHVPDPELAHLDLNRDPPQGDGTVVDSDDEADLNSFMYQTVGHQVIPLYSKATGIPLYRQPIVGGAVQSGRDYSTAATSTEDEVESMLQLLGRIKAAHPEANAVSAGAILSTYQRTRVESVATRLGLTPLAYLWKYPTLPGPPSSAGEDEAQLLYDMGAAGLDARIIKVASAALNESFLWENVASAKGATKLKVAASRFGGDGAVLGEGGEFETLVVDGPSRLFKKRIVVGEGDRAVVPEGGGTAWLRIRNPKAVDKGATQTDEESLAVRKPGLLEERFLATLKNMQSVDETDVAGDAEEQVPSLGIKPTLKTWAFIGHPKDDQLSIEADTSIVIDAIRARLRQHELAPRDIISTIVILRSMSDFQTINKAYGSLFADPNPPSRVTIACGDILPQDTKIAIYVTVPEGPSAVDRQGLHVQSRSYWAPANIGPYSQAITLKVGPAKELPRGPRIAHIAGQIPLVPATMELPGEGGLEMQLVLSLQHLWRIGVEMGVQWWTSAAIYFPRTTRSKYDLTAQDKATLAWRAWRAAHHWVSPGLLEDDSGPDLWDRKFNSKYLFYGGGGEADKARKANLPYYTGPSAGDATDEADEPRTRPVPFFFAAEVDELPRSAEAEWHAHAGLINVPWREEDVGLFKVYDGEKFDTVDGARCHLSHSDVVLEDGAEAHAYLHSAAAIEAPGNGCEEQQQQQAGALEGQIEEASKLVALSNEGRFGCVPCVRVRGERPESSLAEARYPVPYLVYVNCEVFEAEQIGSVMRDLGLAAVPCASLYGGLGGGTRFTLVAMYRTMLGPADEKQGA